MIELPFEKKKPVIIEPRKLFIFSQPKVGKTSLTAQLPNSLIIDFEDSADFYESSSINIKKECLRENKVEVEILGELIAALKAAYVSGKTYDFIIIDSTTALEKIASKLALKLYKKSVVGKKFEGSDVITELSNGAGYEWLRKAFEAIYVEFGPLPTKCLILLGHVKNASINKDGKELTAKDINLTGKLKLIVSGDVDAVGYMYRNGDSNENIISFKTNDQDLATGSRLPYLSGKEILISKMEDGVLKTYWENIFPSLKTSK